MSKRIPISAGFYIQFSVDGRPLSGGLKEEEAMQMVLFWLRIHQDHPDRELVQEWIAKKEQQVERDRHDALREELSKRANGIWQTKASISIDPEIVEIFRSGAQLEEFKRHGIPPPDED